MTRGLLRTGRDGKFLDGKMVSVGKQTRHADQKSIYFVDESKASFRKNNKK